MQPRVHVYLWFWTRFSKLQLSMTYQSSKKKKKKKKRALTKTQSYKIPTTFKGVQNKGFSTCPVIKRAFPSSDNRNGGVILASSPSWVGSGYNFLSLALQSLITSWGALAKLVTGYRLVHYTYWPPSFNSLSHMTRLSLFCSHPMTPFFEQFTTNVRQSLNQWSPFLDDI